MVTKNTLKILCISLVLCTACGTSGKKRDKAVKVSIEWKDTLYDFGTIRLDCPVDSFDFKFKNVGTERLVILNAEPSCPCTTVDYPKKTIEVGEEAVIRVFYNGTGQSPESFMRSVEVHTNATMAPTILWITGKLAE